MKNKIKTLRTSQVTVETKTVVINYGDGQIAEFTDVPDFKGPRVHLPGANSPEFWEKNPNSGYRKQMEMASIADARTTRICAKSTIFLQATSTVCKPERRRRVIPGTMTIAPRTTAIWCW